MSIRALLESLLPHFIMKPVEQRRAIAKAESWKADQLADRMALRGNDWDEVCKRAGGYNNNLISDIRVARWSGRPKGRSIAERSVLSLLIPNFGAATNITDFGGGTGDLGEELSQLYRDIVYTVVETPHMVSLMQPKSKTPNVAYTTEIPAQCDIFYISGVLQYLDDPLSVLERGLLSAGAFGVVRHTRLHDTAIFDVQVSHLFEHGLGPIPEQFQNVELRAPRRTLSEAAITNLAERLGFTLCYRVPENMEFYDGVYSMEMVFRRTVAPVA